MLVSLHQSRNYLFVLWGAKITHMVPCASALVGVGLQNRIPKDVVSIALSDLLIILSQESTSMTDDMS